MYQVNCEKILGERTGKIEKISRCRFLFLDSRFFGFSKIYNIESVSVSAFLISRYRCRCRLIDPPLVLNSLNTVYFGDVFMFGKMNCLCFLVCLCISRPVGQSSCLPVFLPLSFVFSSKTERDSKRQRLEETNRKR